MGWSYTATETNPKSEVLHTVAVFIDGSLVFQTETKDLTSVIDAAINKIHPLRNVLDDLGDARGYATKAALIAKVSTL